MARPGGNPNLCGNKNSGRKSAWEEDNKVEAINTLWAKLNRKIQAGKNLSKFEEQVVHSILPKTVKQERDITSDGEKIIIMPQAAMKKYGLKKGEE